MHTLFTEKINKIAVTVNDDKRIQTPNRVISYPYDVGPGKVCKVELMRYTKLKRNIMINFDGITGENTQKHYLYWSQVPDHSYRILNVGSSGSGKTNVLLSLVNHQTKIDINFLYSKGTYESKYQYLYKNREEVGLKN